MKILFDDQIFSSQKIGGISRYFYELYRSFDKIESIEWELSIIYSNNEYLKQLQQFDNNLLPYPTDTARVQKSFLKGLNFLGKSTLFKLYDKIYQKPDINVFLNKNREKSIEKIKKGDFDIFHPTYYDNYFLDIIGDKPYVLTVHDLIHQIFPEYGLYETRDKNKLMLDRANAIITVSENTKKDLINVFNIKEDKINVVHLANSLDPNVTEIKFNKNLPEKYFLYVGNRDLYKNFLFFVQIFSSLKENFNDINIVCTGSPFNATEIYFFNKLGVNNNLYCYFVNDAELKYLYHHAIALVFPSLYEGFGLPVLEAFSCGCPAVISSSGSLTEVGGDAVIYFEPKNPESLSHALQLVINNNELKNDKVTRGYSRLKDFSWENTACKTLKVYENVIQRNAI